MPTSAQHQLQSLQAALQQFSSGTLAAAALGDHARGQADLLQALPPRYGEVLLNLLDRLESSALFSEESCSFSQKGLIDSLRLWLDKARAILEAPHHPA